MKYIDEDKLTAVINNRIMSVNLEELGNFGCHRVWAYNDVKDIISSLQQEQDMGEVSDGYHTFNELYYYRMLYNAAFFNLLPKEWVHKSKRHHTGEECFGGGWFIVMANLPTGQVSNHYELKDWDLFKVPEKEFANEWDGHTPQEAAERIKNYLQQEQPINMIQWTGNNLKEVIDFTGKSPRFGEWFKSWEEYENYVHSHNDILKLFCEDGSHYEVPVGAWIVKTPDGYNVPSVARFIHAKQEQPDGLDEAAYQVVYDMSHDWLYDNATWEQVQDAFKAGAEWMSEQFEKSRLDALRKVKALRDAQNMHAKTLNYGYRCLAIRLGKEVDEMLDKLKIK